MQYGWSDTAVNTGSNPALTGNWTPLVTDPSGFLQVASQPSAATYQNVVTGVSGSQFQIPVGVYNWSVVVMSGTAFLNGFPVVGTTTNPGPGFGAKSSNVVNVGITGGTASITYTI